MLLKFRRDIGITFSSCSILDISRPLENKLSPIVPMNTCCSGCPDPRHSIFHSASILLLPQVNTIVFYPAWVDGAQVRPIHTCVGGCFEALYALKKWDSTVNNYDRATDCCATIFNDFCLTIFNYSSPPTVHRLTSSIHSVFRLPDKHSLYFCLCHSHNQPVTSSLPVPIFGQLSVFSVAQVAHSPPVPQSSVAPKTFVL